VIADRLIDPNFDYLLPGVLSRRARAAFCARESSPRARGEEFHSETALLRAKQARSTSLNRRPGRAVKAPEDLQYRSRFTLVMMGLQKW
jgi:hypothetical protein